jgi:hypothetical protein
VLVDACGVSLVFARNAYDATGHAPVGFHRIMLLKSKTSSSSVHGSFKYSAFSLALLLSADDTTSALAFGVEASLTRARFRGGMAEGEL